MGVNNAGKKMSFIKLARKIEKSKHMLRCFCGDISEGTSLATPNFADNSPLALLSQISFLSVHELSLNWMEDNIRNWLYRTINGTSGSKSRVFKFCDSGTTRFLKIQKLS